MAEKDVEIGYEKRERKSLPLQVIDRVLQWNIKHGVDNINGLNKKIKDGTYPQLILDMDAFYMEFIEAAANSLMDHAQRVRVVIVAGPSSSGKTTTTIKIAERLGKEGLEFIPFHMDNYFFNLEMHPKDEYGDYDFETPQALDIELINEHLAALIEGKRVDCPIYDFPRGVRKEETEPMQLKENQILLIDCLHGLYPEMTASVPEEIKFKVYIETLSQMKDVNGEWTRWCDNRMLRRMIRDMQFRSYDPVATIGHWHYVRRSEMRHIIPFIDKTDFVINGALCFELPIHKHFLYKYLPKAMEEFKADPKKIDAYTRAKRVRKLLDSVEEWSDMSVVPKKSLMREFIGGSGYMY